MAVTSSFAKYSTNFNEIHSGVLDCNGPVQEATEQGFMVSPSFRVSPALSMDLSGATRLGTDLQVASSPWATFSSWVFMAVLPFSSHPMMLNGTLTSFFRSPSSAPQCFTDS